MLVAEAVDFERQGRTILSGVDWPARPAGRVHLLGHSGSGKSTWLKLLAGLLVPTRGSIRLDGVPPARDRRHTAERVGVVFQDPSGQLVAERVADEVAFPLEQLGWQRSALIDRVESLLHALGLEALAERPVARLSGGEMQRVAVAAALAANPAVVLLDEPTSFLDPAARRAVEVLVADQARGRWLVETSPFLEGSPAGALAVLQAGHWVNEIPAVPDLASEAGATPADWPRPAPATTVTAAGLVVGYDGAPLLGPGLDFCLAPGQIVGVEGPSGSGKTALLMTLAGLIAARGGRFDPPLAVWRAETTYVPQFAERFFYRASAAAELAAAGGALELEVAAAMGLDEPALARSPYRLSGGEQRRLALACAVLRRRPILLLDEPAAGLDGPGWTRLALLLRLHAEAGGSAVVASHRPLPAATHTMRLGTRS